MARWPVPHPLPKRWPKRKHYALIKISAPKGLTGPEVRREVKTMVNNLRYSDGFPGEVRVVAIYHVSDVTRMGLRYHLKRLPQAPRKRQIESDRRRPIIANRIKRKRKAKITAAQNAVPRRRKSPWA
jgi:hypothetical protein